MARAQSLVGLAIAIGVLSAPPPAAAKPTPAAKCESAKLKAVGKQAVAAVGCHVKAVQKARPLDPACVAKAAAAFTKAVGKAEAKPGCTSVGDTPVLQPIVDGFVAAVIAVLPGGDTKEAGKCAGSKRKASAQYASATLLCHGKAAIKAVAVDPACIAKAEGAFQKAFAKAEEKGGCATLGDAGALDQTVDGAVGAVLAVLMPTPTTTVTTTSLPGTTTTMVGPTVHTVMVGAGGGIAFEPAALTIKVGDTVHWVWGSFFHNVVSGPRVNGNGMPDGKFCSPNNMNCSTAPTSDLGATYDFTFTVAGTYPYFCAPHVVLGMTGTITVVP